MKFGLMITNAFAMYRRHFLALVASTTAIIAIAFLYAFGGWSLAKSIVIPILYDGRFLEAIALILLFWCILGFGADILGLLFGAGQYRMLIDAERKGT